MEILREQGNIWSPLSPLSLPRVFLSSPVCERHVVLKKDSHDWCTYLPTSPTSLVNTTQLAHDSNKSSSGVSGKHHGQYHYHHQGPGSSVRIACEVEAVQRHCHLALSALNPAPTPIPYSLASALSVEESP